MKDEGFIVLGHHDNSHLDEPIAQQCIRLDSKVVDLTVAQFMALLKQSTLITVYDLNRGVYTAVDRITTDSKL